MRIFATIFSLSYREKGSFRLIIRCFQGKTTDEKTDRQPAWLVGKLA